MKVAIVTGLFTKGDVEVEGGHFFQYSVSSVQYSVFSVQCSVFSIQ